MQAMTRRSALGLSVCVVVAAVLLSIPEAFAWRFDPGGVIEGTQKKVEKVVKKIDSEQKKLIRNAQNEIEKIISEADKKSQKLVESGQKQAAHLHRNVIKKSVEVFSDSPMQLERAIKLAPTYVYVVQKNGFKRLHGLSGGEDDTGDEESSLIGDFIDFVAKLISGGTEEKKGDKPTEGSSPPRFDPCFAWVATGITPAGHHRQGGGTYCRNPGEKGAEAITSAMEEAKRHLGCDGPGGSLVSFQIVHPGGVSTSYPVN